MPAAHSTAITASRNNNNYISWVHWPQSMICAHTLYTTCVPCLCVCVCAYIFLESVIIYGGTRMATSALAVKVSISILLHKLHVPCKLAHAGNWSTCMYTHKCSTAHKLYHTNPQNKAFILHQNKHCLIRPLPAFTIKHSCVSSHLQPFCKLLQKQSPMFMFWWWRLQGPPIQL